MTDEYRERAWQDCGLFLDGERHASSRLIAAGKRVAQRYTDPESEPPEPTADELRELRHRYLEFVAFEQLRKQRLRNSYLGELPFERDRRVRGYYVVAYRLLVAAAAAVILLRAGGVI